MKSSQNQLASGKCYLTHSIKWILMHYAYFSRCDLLVWPHTISLITLPKHVEDHFQFLGVFLHHKWQNTVWFSTAAVKHLGSFFIVWLIQFVSADCCLSKFFSLFLAVLICMTLVVNVYANHLPTLLCVFSLNQAQPRERGGGNLSSHDPARCFHCTAECCLVSLNLF